VYTEDDEAPPITGRLKDASDNPVDITGYAITLHLDRPPGHSSITKTAAIVDAPNGVFQVDWAAGDLKEGLQQLAEVQIIDTGSKPQTSPKFFIDVATEIA
jgi:hypothetical protein